MDSGSLDGVAITIKSLLNERSGALFHIAAAISIFIVWRLLGIPAPGSLGRIIPLSWFITGLVFGKGRTSGLSSLLLSVFLALSMLWAVSHVIEVLAVSFGLLGIFPGLLAVSRKKAGLLRSMVPLIPLIVLIPFGGDEPHYATITEDFVSPGAGEFGNMHHQTGDPSERISHHQIFYPLLMIPGYPFSVAGVRGMNLLFTLIAVLILSWIFRKNGLKNWKYLSVLGILMIPGSSILGMVFPGWVALLFFLFGVRMAESRQRTFWILCVSFILVMIKIRFVGLSAGLLIALIVSTEGKKKIMFPAAIAGLVILGLLADLIVLDGHIFWVRYGNIAFLKTVIIQPVYRFPEILLAACSSFVDIESGILWKAPWIIAGLAGLPLLRKNFPDLFLWLGLPAILYLFTLVFWSTNAWAGMPAPSGRMLLPLMPVLLASLGCMLKDRRVDFLIWMSLGISAIYFVYPVLRFNRADGTDALVSLLGGQYSNVSEWIPNAVRFNLSIFAGWLALTGLSVWLLIKRTRHSAIILGIPLLLVAFVSGQNRIAWEAEDIPSEFRTYCSIYPESINIEDRLLWLFSREKMLLMSNPEDAVVLPIPDNHDDTIRVFIALRSLQSGPMPGIELSYGNFRDSIYASSGIMEIPEWIGSEKSKELEHSPENLEEILVQFSFIADTTDTIRLSPLSVGDEYGEKHGIYLDRIEFR